MIRLREHAIPLVQPLGWLDCGGGSRLLADRPGLGFVFAGQLQVVELRVEQLELDPLAPAVVQFVLVLGIRNFLGVDVDRLIDGEVVRGVNQLVSHLDLPVEPLQIHVPHVVSELRVAGLQEVVQVELVFAQFVDVRLREVQLLRIEILQKSFEQLFRDFVVNRPLTDVEFLDHVADEFGGRFIAGMIRRQAISKGGD